MSRPVEQRRRQRRTSHATWTLRDRPLAWDRSGGRVMTVTEAWARQARDLWNSIRIELDALLRR